MTDQEFAGMNPDWYEIWVDDGASPPYVLLAVSAEPTGERVRILDIQEGNKIIFEADNYEAAKIWLLEDEYERIGDRVIR